MKIGFYMIALAIVVNSCTSKEDKAPVEDGPAQRGTIDLMRDSIADFDNVIKLDPKNAEAYLKRGILKHSLKDPGVIQDYNKAIELDPKNAEAYMNRGWYKAFLHDYYAAIADFDKAIELNPKYGEAYCGRGLNKITVHDNSEGCSDLTKAAKLGYVEAHRWRDIHCY